MSGSVWAGRRTPDGLHPSGRVIASLWIARRALRALFFAWAIGTTDISQPLVRQTFATSGREGYDGYYVAILLRASPASWLIALMVWLLPVSQTARLSVIITTYIIRLERLSHIIAGSAETLCVMVSGGESRLTCLER
jgi:formate-nitrite transporter family protein